MYIALNFVPAYPCHTAVPAFLIKLTWSKQWNVLHHWHHVIKFIII